MFQYVTFRTALASLTALFLSPRAGAVADRASCANFRLASTFAKTVRKSHQKKAGTPTMGGLLIMHLDRGSDAAVGRICANPYVWIALFGLVSFGAIGFLDDYAEGAAQAKPGADGAQKFGAASRWRRCWSAFCCWRCTRKEHTPPASTCRSSNTFKPDLLIDALTAQLLDLSAGLRAVLRVHRCW